MPPDGPNKSRRFFGDLPRHAKILVHAAVFGVGVSGAIACGPTLQDAPTCGPCCHDPNLSCGPGGEVELSIEERAREIEEQRRQQERDRLEEERRQRELAEQRRLEEERRAHEGQGGGLDELAPDTGPVAPTCGPCCHGYNGPECGGPSRIGPAVRPADDDD
jgi:hypothetical protein